VARGAQPGSPATLTPVSGPGRGSAEAAQALAAGLVEARLAACVQIVGPIRSVSRWDGAVQDDEELQCWIQTAGDRVCELTDWIVDRERRVGRR
jgi:uncharacterized protein involved in tolerance to divalent cations